MLLMKPLVLSSLLFAACILRLSFVRFDLLEKDRRFVCIALLQHENDQLSLIDKCGVIWRFKSGPPLRHMLIVVVHTPIVAN